MKISIQPALYNNASIQPSKNSAAKSKQAKDSFELSSGPSFAGGFTGKNKIASLLVAVGASLLVLAGCGQSKQQANIGGGTGYVPPSYSQTQPEEEQDPTSAGDTPAANAAAREQNKADKAAEEPKYPIYQSLGPEYPGGPNRIVETEESKAARELDELYHELDTITQNIGQINNDLDAARNELKTKQAEMEKAEEKLGTYKRKDPNDKPPGFEADYNRYVDLCNDVKGLQSLILKLETEKANAEAKQDETIARVSELGGHPHLG